MLTLISHQGDIHAVEDYVEGTFDFIEYEGGAMTCWVQQDRDTEPLVWATIVTSTNPLHDPNRRVLIGFSKVEDSRWPGRLHPRVSKAVLSVSVIRTP